jgi:hypothetical protein
VRRRAGRSCMPDGREPMWPALGCRSQPPGCTSSRGSCGVVVPGDAGRALPADERQSETVLPVKQRLESVAAVIPQRCQCCALKRGATSVRTPQKSHAGAGSAGAGHRRPRPQGEMADTGPPTHDGTLMVVGLRGTRGLRRPLDPAAPPLPGANPHHRGADRARRKAAGSCSAWRSVPEQPNAFGSVLAADRRGARTGG